MVLRRIGTDETTSYEVPWIGDFVKQGGNVGDSCFVESIRLTEKGFLVLCTDFKGFLFSRSAIYGFVAEAIKHWIDRSYVSYPLYGIVEKGNKLVLAVDDQETLTDWIEVSKDTHWEQRRKKAQDGGSKLKPSNPFLLTPPPTSNGKRGTPKDMPTIPSAMS